MGPLNLVPSEHEAVPQPGTAYSMEGRNTGLPADLGCFWHFPAEALCVTCGTVIRRERYMRLSPGDAGEWKHTGRKPGDA